jgi:hypothetical protein
MLISFILFFGTSQTVLPWDTTSAKYFPLQVGNVWVYNGFGYPCCGPYIYKVKVTGSAVLNGHLYYKLKSTLSSDTTYVRVDSSRGIILFRNTTNSCGWLNQETTGDSLAARINDSSTTLCINRAKCTDTANQVIFSITKKGKTFNNMYFEGYETRRYLVDFGLVNIYTVQHTNSNSRTLKGCVITV